MRRSRQHGLTLIELLISMAILCVITTMILAGWFALSQSYSYSVKSADARDSGRQAINRMQREIRDVEQPPLGYLSGTAADAGLYRARAYWIAFCTTFNDAGNDTEAWQLNGSTYQAVATTPHLVVYRLYSDGKLYRFEDTNGNGTISNVNLSPSVDNPTGFSLSEETNGEGATLLLSNVVNYTATSTPKPVFRYNSYDTDGNLNSAPYAYNGDRYGVIAVQLELLVDVNPRKSPVYADLISTAQLRNQR